MGTVGCAVFHQLTFLTCLLEMVTRPLQSFAVFSGMQVSSPFCK